MDQDNVQPTEKGFNNAEIVTSEPRAFAEKYYLQPPEKFHLTTYSCIL